MRLRDVPKHWCGFCWTVLSALSVFWVICVVVMIWFAATNMAVAALAGLVGAVTGVVILWCGYAEANRHYRVDIKP